MEPPGLPEQDKITNVESAPSDIDLHRELARLALCEYGLTDCEPVFVRHNENLTYHTHGPAHTQDYLLRIHMPCNATFKGVQQSRIAIMSELAWLSRCGETLVSCFNSHCSTRTASPSPRSSTPPAASRSSAAC